MPLRNLLVIIVTAIFSLTCYNTASKNRFASLFGEAIRIVEKESLYEVPANELFESAMNGMMKKLDEHSIFVTKDLYREINEDMDQEFGGVGMYVDKDPQTQKLVVLAPIPNSPAFEAGVLAGDEIVKIAGEATDKMSQSDAVKKMRGPQDTTVDVVFQRKDQFLRKTLNRKVIPVPSVHGDWRKPDGSWNYTLKDMPNIGYVRLLQFGRRSAEEMQTAFDEFAGNVDGVILDLRNNTGGLLPAAVGICDMFVNKGEVIVRTRGRGRKLLEETLARSEPTVNVNLPMIVLVNRNSASASEILSGCLQDYDRAIIVGEQTWGKGTVQSMINMQHKKSALKLTVASFWRPSDRNIDRNAPAAKESKVWGIQPNEGFEIKMTEEEVFRNIRERNRRDLEGLRTNLTDPSLPADQTPAAQPEESEIKPVPQTPHQDRPLERAKEYFRKSINQAVAA